MIHTFPTTRSSAPAPEWSLYGDGHVIAGAIIVGQLHVEARILLDGEVLYCSRHKSHDVAREELRALRGEWANKGWSEPN